MKKILTILATAIVAAVSWSATQQDARRPFLTFEQRAEAGDSEAQYRLATILETGWDSIPRDSVRALRMIRRSAAAEFPPAMNYLGYLYDKGYRAGGKELVNVNADSSVYWLKKSADMNDPRAMSNLAYLLLNRDTAGKSTDEINRNRSMAVEYLEKASDAGAPTAMSMLADLYRNGEGVPCDTVRAMDLYEQALQSGLGDAEPRLITLMIGKWNQLPRAEQLHLGEQYLTTYAPAAGVLLLERAATLPAEPVEIPLAAHAMKLLGDATSRGIGVHYDAKKGLEYYVRAALLGDSEARTIVDDLRGLYPDTVSEIESSLISDDNP